MAEVDLTQLGEMMVRVQDDMRDLRGRVSALETNLIRLEGDVAKGIHGLDGRIDHLDGRMDHLDARVDHLDGKLDRLDASWEARFQQLHQTMTTNFAIVIEALKGR